MSTEVLVETLVEQVKTTKGWPDPKLLAEILARGSEAVAPLRALLQRDYKKWPDVDCYYFAAEILGSLGESAAIPEVLSLFRRIDDGVLDPLSKILGEFGPSIIEPALEVIRDDSLPPCSRGFASDAAIFAAGDDAVARAKIAEPLREMLADCLRRGEEAKAKLPSDIEDEEEDDDGDLDELEEKDDDDEEMDDLEEDEAAAEDERELEKIDNKTFDFYQMATIVVDSLANLADPLARELIDSAYEADIIDTWMIRREDVEEVYAKGGNIPRQKRDPFLTRYERDYADEQKRKRRLADDEARRLASPQAGPSTEPRPRVPNVEPIRKTTPRPGRNDPCWCGSGKKYKQCHLRADEG